MPVLAHVEIEPCILVIVLAGTAAAGGVPGHQMASTVTLAEATGHGPGDLVVGVRLGRPIATENPDDTCFLVTTPEPFPVRFSIGWRENFRTGAPLFVPLVAPGGEEADIDPKRIRFGNDPVDVLKVGIVGLGGVVVDERLFAVRVRVVEAVELGEGDGLDNGVVLFRTDLEIGLGVVPVQAVEEFPGGIAQPEERFAVVGDQKAMVVAYLQLRKGCGMGDRGEEADHEEQPAEPPTEVHGRIDGNG
jgi:hypothetical protein